MTDTYFEIIFLKEGSLPTKRQPISRKQLTIINKRKRTVGSINSQEHSFQHQDIIGRLKKM